MWGLIGYQIRWQISRKLFRSSFERIQIEQCMNRTDVTVSRQLANKAEHLLREMRNTLEHAWEAIENARPLMSDPQIIEPLNQTFAANTLNQLVWALYTSAAVDTVKATFDDDERSASLATVYNILDRPEVLAELRSRRTAPVYMEPITGEGIGPQEARQLADEFMRNEQERAGKEFDDGLATTREQFRKLRESDEAKRLCKARNKIMAHTDTVLDGDKFRRRTPEDYGLRWGDPETVAAGSTGIMERLFVAILGVHTNTADSRRIFAANSDAFWAHLRTGLAIASGGPDKPVRKI